MSRTIGLLLLLAAPGAAQAASVFLNGVNIDGVTGKSFENCTVRIDEHGNVFIVAKGYVARKPGEVAAPEVPVAVTPGGPPTKRYWLVTEKAAPGMTQYDIDLFVNSKWVRKFLDQEDHVVMEITKYLQQGANKIHFVAKKDLGSARRSSSPQHYFRIIVGEGNSGGRNVMISRKAIEYKRTALETQNFQEEFVLDVR